VNAAITRFTRPPSAAIAAGMALLLCLLFLAALTLLGLAAASETVMQDRLAGNLQETGQARQSALAGQHWAEEWLLGYPEVAPLPCNQPCAGLVIHASGTLPAKPETENPAWWSANGMEAGLDPVSGERLATLSIASAAPPVWIIEALHEETLASDAGNETQAWYRILARGSGHAGKGVAVVESIITRPWRPTPVTSTVTLGPCPGFDSSYGCERVAWRTLR
jgi:Tfp pilus assembly protein PilX